MSDFANQFTLAQHGDLKAFDTIVLRFQDMAVGYAYSVLGDFPLAQDAAQEAFVEAYPILDRVYGPGVFPAWLRRLVFKHCDRLTRNRRVDTVPLLDGDDIPSSQKDPASLLEDCDTRAWVLREVNALPDEERQTVTLFYISEYSHAEIGHFLDLSPATVNNRLRAARKKLKKRITEMAKDELQQSAPSRDRIFVSAVHFCNAAQTGDLSQISEMLSADPAVIHAVHPQHKSKALHLAVRQGHTEVVRLLLQAGADPLEDFDFNRYRNCPLTLARFSGHHRIVELIEEHLSAQFEQRQGQLDAQDENGNTLLHQVVYHRHQPLVADLLHRGADTEARNRWGQKPIHLALYKGASEQLQRDERHRPDRMTAGLLLEHGAVNDIWVASVLGETHIVRRLLEQDPALANYYNGAVRHPGGISYPLTAAAWQGHIEIVRLLLDSGSDVNVTNTNDPHEDGWVENGAPLMMALTNRHLAVAELLLDRGAKADVGTYAGPTALELAEENGYDALATRLIAQGARHNFYTYATRGDHLLIGELLDRCGDDVVGKGNKWNIAGYFLLNGVRGQDETIVAMCLRAHPRLARSEVHEVLCNVMRFDRQPGDQEGQIKLLRLCLEHGLDSNAPDEEGFGLLHGLSFKYWSNGLSDGGRAAYAAMLLDYGAELDVPDTKDRLRPLSWACQYGRKTLVELLLKRGALVTVEGEKNEAAPLTRAKQSGFDDIVHMLKQADSS